MKSLQLFFLLISAFAFSQNLSINGNLKNSSGEAVSEAQVSLFNQKNELVKTTVSQNGAFDFNNLNPQTYHLEIETATSNQKEAPFELVSDKSFSIVINDKTTVIAEVKLTSKKKNFKVEKGNINIEIANTSFSKVASSTDLLTKLPFVTIDANGEGISMVGKGSPLLYVDNQKVDFSTVSGISVDDIKSVEIIRNPSAKYEAEGKAVIKIILKNSKKEGSTLTLAETATLNKRFSNNFSANYQRKKNKTEWKLNGAYNQIQHWESNGYDYSVPTKNISSNYIIKSETTRPQTIFGAGIYQDLGNDGDYLSLNFNANFRPDKGDNKTVTHYEKDNLPTNILTLNHQNRQRASVNSTFNYNKNLKSISGNLFAGFQFNRESDKVDYEFFNNVDNQGYVFSQFRKNKYGANAYSGKVDFEKKIKDDYLLAIGLNYTRAEALTNNVTDFAENLASDFYRNLFTEENKAVYSEFSGEKGKWSFKGGIRMEATKAKGTDLLVNQDNINRKYVDWFPSGEVSFKQNKDFVYTLNYSRAISRPSYGDLAGGGLYGSPFVEYGGNPNLLPTYTSTLSASVNLKKWALNASYYQSKNPMGFSLIYLADKNISKFTTLNFDRETGASVGVDVPLSYKIWSSQNSFLVNYSKTEDSLAVVNKPTPYIYLYTNNTVKLGKGFDFLLDGSWITKRIEGLYEHNAMVLVNLGLTKSVSNFDFTLRYNDVFKQNIYKQSLKYDSIVTKGTFYGNTPVISLSLKYNFGKVSNSNFKEKAVNEATGRM